MHYGVGHHGWGSGSCAYYSGDPGDPGSHPHVAAIEVALHHRSIGEVPYTLMGMSVPLSEVLYSFLDDTGLRSDKERSEWALEFQGRRLGPKETPESLDLDAFAEWPAAVFEVVEIGFKKMMAVFGAMNRLGTALCIGRSGLDTQLAYLVANVDGLGQIFSLLELEDLYPVSRTCALWHNVSQRLSLLLQLQCSMPPAVEYPAYLKLITEFSSHLDIDTCRAVAREKLQWESLGLCKEQEPDSKRRPQCRWDRPAMFTKAAGCTSMRTVEAACPLEQLRKQTLPLRSPHTRFMLEQGSVLSVDRFAKSAASVPVSTSKSTLSEQAVEALQEKVVQLKRAFFSKLEEETSVRRFPAASEQSKYSPPSSDSQGERPGVVRAADVALRQMSIELFREYFSPSMHLIFPLIAHQQALHDLDFTTTQTWGVRYAGKNVGAVAWRIRKPLLAVHKEDACHMPVPILEVLFISVWEEYRNSEFGSLMVAALEEEAGTHRCGFIYVEVGHEQPLARRFWAKNGFSSTREAGVTKEQSLFFEHACLRFADTEQYVKRLSAKA